MLCRFAVDEDWLHEVAIGMEIEDDVVWVCGLGDDGILSFTDEGIEHLQELARMREDCPHLAHAPRIATHLSVAHAGWIR